MQILKKTKCEFDGSLEMSGSQTNTPATIAMDKLNSKDTACYEYFVQKLIGMTAEECVLLAVALDFHRGCSKSPLAASPIVELATCESENDALTFIRILIVVQSSSTEQTKSRVSMAKVMLHDND